MGHIQSNGGFIINVTGAISGTAGEVAYFDSVNSITSDSGLTYDAATTRFGIGTAPSANTTALIRGTGTTGTDQRILIVDGIFQSSATGTGYTISSQVQTAAASFTLGVAAAFRVLSATVDTGSTVTRLINYFGATQTAGTNNAFLSDNTSFSGNWFINSTSTASSLLSGSLAIGTGTPSSTNLLAIRQDQDAKTAISVFNANAGSSANAEVRLTNDTDDFRLTLDSNAGGNLANIVANSGLSGLNIATLGTDPVTIKSNNTLGITLDSVQNVVLGSAALATNVTDGFLYIASCAGTPTGVPTSKTGRVPMIYDTTNDKFYIYRGGWKGVTLS